MLCLVSFGTLELEFAMLQSQTRLCGQSAHSHFCSNVSVTARTFSRQVKFYTSHRVRENQRTQAFCAYATFIHEAPALFCLCSPVSTLSHLSEWDSCSGAHRPRGPDADQSDTPVSLEPWLLCLRETRHVLGDSRGQMYQTL